MPDKLYLIRFNGSDISIHVVFAARVEIHEEHLVFLRSDGRLAACFSWKLSHIGRNLNSMTHRRHARSFYRDCISIFSESLRTAKFILAIEWPRGQRVLSLLFLSGTSIVGWPPATGGWGLGQPFRVPVQFAPAAHIGVPGNKEINGTLKFVRPVFPGRDGALSGIDVDN